MSEVKPIKPEEVKPVKPEFPDFVIEAFNELIQKKWDEDKGRSKIEQEEAIEKIIEKSSKDGKCGIKRHEIFDKYYLDVENLYRENGWDVKYFKQPYYETKEDHFFIFRKKSKN